jgi:Tfp pilus assembly protein PilX
MTTPRRTDDGAALILTVMVIALVGVLTTTILGVTVSNLSATRRTQDSARALDAADAGLTQAVTYLRTSGTRGLACDSTCQASTYGAPLAPAGTPVTGSTDLTYQTWIRPLSTSNARDKEYRVTSRGAAGTGVRVLQADVTLTLANIGLPLGIFARSIQGGGTPDLDGISVFSTGCVFNRSKLGFTSAPDAAYGIPTAVHSSKIITDSNGNSANACAASDNKNIHDGGTPPATSPTRCRAAGDRYRWDQDSIGGSCTALASAYSAYYGPKNLDADPDNDVDGTYLQDDQALLELFGLNADPLPASKLDELKSIARSQVDTRPASHNYGNDNYWTTTSFEPPDPDQFPDSVLYFDLTNTDPGGVVDLSDLEGKWGQSGCQSRSLLIIIEGGNVRINGNGGSPAGTPSSTADIAASVVLTSKTYGEVDKGNGTPSFVGTMFANTVNLAGTIDLALNSCFLSNLSPSLYSAVVEDYRELDRSG